VILAGGGVGYTPQRVVKNKSSGRKTLASVPRRLAAEKEIAGKKSVNAVRRARLVHRKRSLARASLDWQLNAPVQSQVAFRVTFCL